MKTTAKWQLTWGLAIAVGFAGIGQTAAADSQAEGPTLTIHVRNEAGVESETLREAELAASGIFQKAGVGCTWVDAPVKSQDSKEAVADPPSYGLSQIRLNILPRTMFDRLEMPATVTGLAPGAGPDRVLVYVSSEGVQGLAHREAQRQVVAQAHGNPERRATEAQILGEVFAHEIGHILLNLPGHSRAGIMRGEWDLHDLSDIAEGYLNFTREQSKVIEAEVVRRVHEDQIEVANTASGLADALSTPPELRTRAK